ncbi:MAG: dockerin type I repeat-containing protein [Clostridiales bacterium]|nr:dockerin type I repeat-containing protein [Clostridiales bacterium]
MKKLSYILSFAVVIMAGIILFAGMNGDTAAVSEAALADYGSCGEGNHVYTDEYTVISEATCTSTGMKYRKCTVCGEIEYVTIPIDPDNHASVSSSWIYDPKPTCVEGGARYKICYDCNSQIDYEELPADSDAHTSKSSAVTVREATCVTQGYNAYVCSLCGEYFDGYTTDIDPDNHITSEWSVRVTIKEATCYEEGEAEVYCDACGLLAYTETIERTDDHTWSDERTVDAEPTCSSAGSSSIHCIYCDAVTDVEEIPIEPDNHTFSEEYTVDTAATCVSEGQMSRHCIYCDAVTDVTVIPIDETAHQYGDEWIITREPTCSEFGLQHKVCTLCGESSADVMIDKTEHTYSDDYVILETSADELSAKVMYVCTVCGYENIVIKTYGTGEDDIIIDDVTAEPKYLTLSDSSIYVLDNDNMTISNIKSDVTASDFMSNFTNSSSFVLYDENWNFIEDTDTVGTGFHVYYEDVYDVVTDYTVMVIGDVNSDGSISSADARVVLRAVAGLDDALEGVYFSAADADGSGALTASDARTILRVSARLEFFEDTYGDWGGRR